MSDGISFSEWFWNWAEMRRMKTDLGRFAIQDYLSTGSLTLLKETFPHTYTKVARLALEDEDRKARSKTRSKS